MKSEAQVTCENLGGTWVKPHTRNGQRVRAYCRLPQPITKKSLTHDTIASIPFGWDAEVAYEYVKYGKKKVKE